MRENKLMINIIETPRRLFGDFDLMSYLDPEEFWLYMFLLNADAIEPSYRNIAEYMGVSYVTVKKVADSLVEKGMLVIEKEGLAFVWIINNVPMNIQKEDHQEFLEKTQKEHIQNLRDRNREIEAQISDKQLELNQLLVDGADYETTETLYKEIIALERSKK